jgi:serine/threonine-protein kinase
VIAAVNALREEGFVVNATQIEEPSEEIEEGKVTRTEPAAAQLVAVGSQISIVVSTGVPTVPVPSVVNLLIDSARSTILLDGLVLGEPIFVDVPAGSPSVGRVISQDPEAFEEVEIGFVVTITVGQAAPETTTTTTTTTPPPTTTYPTTP